MKVKESSASKRILLAGLSALVLAALTARAADAQLDSWFTTSSGKLARLYTTDADKTSGNAVTTWSRGSTTQTLPAYCGVHEVDYSSSWLYLRTSGLAQRSEERRVGKECRSGRSR